MLFLARSALCIGLVAVAASHADLGGLAAALDHGARSAADDAGRACLRSQGCFEVGAAALAAAVGPAAPQVRPRVPRAQARIPRAPGAGPAAGG